MGDNIEEFSASIPLEGTPMITEFTDVSPQDNTLTFFEVTPVITEPVDVLSEDLMDKLPSICDIRHTIDLVSGASLPDLPHHSEFKR